MILPISEYAYTFYKNINTPTHSLVITTDASLLGWGAVYNEQSTGGRWTQQESNCHINELELQAVYFGLRSFFTEISDTHIRVRSDNMTTVTYINNLGGVKSIKCHKIVKNIWCWAISKGIHLSAEFLPGSENTLADSASRIFDENTEWSLLSPIYYQLKEYYGHFSIDLFASRLNSKNEVYASWKPDPSAHFVDAFSRNWNNFHKFYAFPPFSVILKCLHKILVEEARGILVVPLWTTQPWFPKLMGMLTCTPLVLPVNALHLPYQENLMHKQSKSLRLIACQVSGIFLETEAFRNTLLTSYVPLGDHPHVNSTKSILESGCLSVVSNKRIPFVIMKL